MHDVALICVGILVGLFLAVTVIVIVSAPARSSQISRIEEAAHAAKLASDAASEHNGA